MGVARRWVGVRPLVRALVGVQLVVLVWGAVVHLVLVVTALAGPLEVLDARAPGPVAVYWVALAVLDPLAAVLLALRRRVGLGLGAAVLVSDAVVTAYAIHGLGLGGAWAWVGNAAVAVLAATVLVTWPVVSPWLLRWRTPLAALVPSGRLGG